MKNLHILTILLLTLYPTTSFGSLVGKTPATTSYYGPIDKITSGLGITPVLG